MKREADENGCRGCPRSCSPCNLEECVLDDLGRVRTMLDWIPADAALLGATALRQGRDPASDDPPTRVV